MGDTKDMGKRSLRSETPRERIAKSNEKWKEYKLLRKQKQKQLTPEDRRELEAWRNRDRLEKWYSVLQSSPPAVIRSTVTRLDKLLRGL